MTREIGTQRAASFCFSKASIGVGLGLGAFLGVADPEGVAAQETVFVGPNSQAEVIVDLSAIDEAVSKQGKAEGKREAAKASGAQQSVTLTPPALKAPVAIPGEALIVLHPPARNSTKRKETTATTTGIVKSPTGTAANSPAQTQGGPAKGQKPQTTKQPIAQAANTANALPGTSPQPAASTPQPSPAADTAPPAQMAATAPTTAEKPNMAPREAALSIDFGAGVADLPATARADLDKLAASLKKNADARVQLLAYAAGEDSQASQLRRLSLDRALSIRKYLIDQGITSSRIEVHALGNKTDGGAPADRVDLTIVNK